MRVRSVDKNENRIPMRLKAFRDLNSVLLVPDFNALHQLRTTRGN